MEKWIRRYTRWNAAAMVVRANHRAEGIGGHLATFASSAALYERGLQPLLPGQGGRDPGDQVFFQGHAAPGIYSRAFIEGRLSEDQLDHYRMELAGEQPAAGACPPTPTPA